MKITITGALGHIGSALIREINLPEVEMLYLADNFFTQRYASLFNLPEHNRYQFHELDVLSGDIEEIISDSDIVIHLAAVTNAEASAQNQDEVEAINKRGLENVAVLCAKHNTKLLFPSSTSVYGVQEGLVDENCTEKDLKPQSPYAESKIFGEKLLTQLGEEKGLQFVTFRLGTIFGYSIGMRFHTAVNKFIWQATIGKPLTVWKTALHQKRPYCDLKDAISAMQFVIENDLFDNEIYNVLTLNLTVNDIVETIKKYVSDVNIEFVDSPIMNQLSYEVDPNKFVGKGFSYKGNLDESIGETIGKLGKIKLESAPELL